MSGRKLIGTIVGGKYTIRGVLGEGGMGTVFEAEHVTIGRIVAVKVLHPSHLRKQVSVQRFEQEARAAGQVSHPNICEVYDVGTLPDGTPYIIMERLSGATLAERVSKEKGLPPEQVVDIVAQVLSGLIAAHAKGVIHRDIKPENIFLTARAGCGPVVKILDFGVSKMIGNPAAALDLTRTGMVMGTPYYMSPEQARGERDLDARVDVYATGVLTYEALTGRRPFIASNYNALLLQILSATPRPMRELRADLPAGFDTVVTKAMARSREVRYPSAEAFQRDLVQLAGERTDTRIAEDVVMLVRSTLANLPRISPPRVAPSSPTLVSADPSAGGEPQLSRASAGIPPTTRDPQQLEQRPTHSARDLTASGFDDIPTEVLGPAEIVADDAHAAETLRKDSASERGADENAKGS